jgi:membrane-associated protease RseP (regulator of RpoE activity)
MQQQAFIGVYLNGKSLVVSEVIPNTAAARNNMQVNDQLTKLGKTSINNYDELLKALSNYKAGDRVKIEFLRNGQTERQNMVLGSMAEGQAKTASLLKSMCEDGQEKDQANIFPEAMPNLQLSAFPNPSAGQFKVQFESSSKAPIAISISDMSGREVYKADINQFNGTLVQNIDLRNEAKGLYIINVRQDGKLSSQKISLF